MGKSYSRSAQICNYTPYEWTADVKHSYQLDGWNWPTTIPAWSCSPIQNLEWPSKNNDDSAAEIGYVFGPDNNKFQLQGRTRGAVEAPCAGPARCNYFLQVYYENLETPKYASGSIRPIGLQEDGTDLYTVFGDADQGFDDDASP